jgi:hypothetical protein
VAPVASVFAQSEHIDTGIGRNESAGNADMSGAVLWWSIGRKWHAVFQ